MGRMRDLGRAGVEQGSESPAAKPVEGRCCVDRPGTGMAARVRRCARPTAIPVSSSRKMRPNRPRTGWCASDFCRIDAGSTKVSSGPLEQLRNAIQSAAKPSGTAVNAIRQE
jgi:hypothetical protein